MSSALSAAESGAEAEGGRGSGSGSGGCIARCCTRAPRNAVAARPPTAAGADREAAAEAAAAAAAAVVCSRGVSFLFSATFDDPIPLPIPLPISLPIPPPPTPRCEPTGTPFARCAALLREAPRIVRIVKEGERERGLPVPSSTAPALITGASDKTRDPLPLGDAEENASLFSLPVPAPGKPRNRLTVRAFPFAGEAAWTGAAAEAAGAAAGAVLPFPWPFFVLLFRTRAYSGFAHGARTSSARIFRLEPLADTMDDGVGGAPEGPQVSTSPIWCCVNGGWDESCAAAPRQR